ncbi:unnamed protein product [Clonostachys rosea f. rosea IK726]|uniref:CSC1/OSCA1-like 7TM region domain-containing protein n=2 Tax=Bionectria ochroleuca TaxID=29856 RepID=A0A0B7JI01_BIOOC|nr:unnamed protein product [Clonostachys rosea f. rosea IK726]
MEALIGGTPKQVLRAVLSTPITASLHQRADSDSEASNAAKKDQGIGIVSFLTAFLVAVIVFSVQTLLFLLLRNKLARIFKPKTYLVPDRERTESPPSSIFGLGRTLFKLSDREVIQKCGLDAYFFLRYLKTLLVIFIPICVVVMPILIPLNYVGGKGQDINVASDDAARNATGAVVGLDTLSWGNVQSVNTDRYTAHLILAILVIVWVCAVFFFELRVYIKVRQDYLTSAEHRLRASATTVLVSEIPGKWLSEEGLRGLFDVFPGGVRNVWLNRDLSLLLEKVNLRDKIHKKLEQAETDLIKAAKKAQLKMKKAEDKKSKKLSKQERAALDAEQDAQAQEMANSGQGLNAGDDNRASRIGDDYSGLQESTAGAENGQAAGKGLKVIGDPLAKVGHGLRGALNKTSKDLNDELETTHGFVGLGLSRDPAAKSRVEALQNDRENGPRPSVAETLRTQTRTITPDSSKAVQNNEPQRPIGNTVRKLSDFDELYMKGETKFWQFWKPPTGGYASPVPQGQEAADYMASQEANKKTAWEKFKSSLPFMGKEEVKPVEYEIAHNAENIESEGDQPLWQKYLKEKNRPTHRLPLFGVQALPGLPLFSKKVDTIYWCREELARLNLEIEEDQKYPERYPLMSSAFIQFEHQVAAHMACQSTMHHVPKHMAPRVVEISPRDVVWDNMSLPWWQEWARTGVVVICIVAMVLLWAIPVAFTASLSQLDELIRQNEWLSFLKANPTITTVATAVAGVLPAILLSILLILVPIVLDFFAKFKGAKTGSQKAEFVQVFYFFFLFVQVFLIVSVASFFATSIDQLTANIQSLQSVTAVLDLLATNLPKAANYFFSYMILQALSTSSGTLLQIGTLFVWFILARIVDSTARNKWRRNTTLNSVNWGTFFPVYTNFACIGIIYSVIAPLISIFAIITFSLLWVAHRYSMLYVTRFEKDTGGMLYPRAINQTFTGVYFMELCMAGLFFIVKDENDRNSCTPHGIIMLVVLFLTILYQLALNRSFSPLFRYLPITFEDEAVLRDEAFTRAQRRRFGLDSDSSSGDEEDEDATDQKSPRSEKSSSRLRSPVIGTDGAIEMEDIGRKKSSRLRNPMRQVGNWAKGGGNQIRKITATDRKAIEYRRKQRQKDIEAQRAIGDALYGGMNDEIEDLTPDERDSLIRHAFKHAALRARRPTVWLPQDDLGISDDEIRRTQAFSSHIWISNEGTALDSKVRVVYGTNPPDFSEMDVINL